MIYENHKTVTTKGRTTVVIYENQKSDITKVWTTGVIHQNIKSDTTKGQITAAKKDNSRQLFLRLFIKDYNLSTY